MRKTCNKIDIFINCSHLRSQSPLFRTPLFYFGKIIHPLPCRRNRQKGHKKSAANAAYSAAADNKKSAAAAAPKAKSKLVPFRFFARVRANTSFIVVILFILNKCPRVVRSWFICGSRVVRSWFDFENTVPVKPRRLGVQRWWRVVRFLHKADEKPVRTAFAAARTVRGGCKKQRSSARRRPKNTPAPGPRDRAFQTARRGRKPPRETRQNDLFPSGGRP